MSGASPANTGATLDRDNPWPGLASFTEDQSGFFHGRDEEIRPLARLMERKALTVLFGQSGLGKSSLLQTGVFSRLRGERRADAGRAGEDDGRRCHGARRHVDETRRRQAR